MIISKNAVYKYNMNRFLKKLLNSAKAEWKMRGEIVESNKGKQLLLVVNSMNIIGTATFVEKLNVNF